MSPAVTVDPKLLTMILNSVLLEFCFSGFSIFFSVLNAAIGRFLSMDGGLGGLRSLSTGTLLKCFYFTFGSL